MIVIQEEDGGHGFNVFLAGDKERLQRGIKPDEMGPAEFWATKLFEICWVAIARSGAIKSVTRAGGGDA